MPERSADRTAPPGEAVDEELARLGVCGTIDDHTQRRCFLAAGHDGGCHFLHVSPHPGAAAHPVPESERHHRLVPARRRPPDPYPMSTLEGQPPVRRSGG